MSISDWVTNNIVKPTVDELLKPENLTKITEALTAGVIDGVSAQGDRIVAEVIQDSTQAEKVIEAVNGTSKDVMNSVGAMGQTLSNELNTVVSTLFENIKNLFPHIPGFGGESPRPRGRR